MLGPFHTGVGDLYRRVAAHPDVMTSAPAQLHFWAEERPAEALFRAYAPAAASIARTAAGKGEGAGAAAARMVFGDASPSTFSFYRAHGPRFHRDYLEALHPCYAACNDGKSGKSKEEKDACKAACFEPARRAQAAADEARGARLQIPTLMRAAYGDSSERLRLVVTLRDPTERLHNAFWFYGHYSKRYGETPEGFLAYAREQIGGVRACLEAFSERDCVLNFEGLRLQEERLFFHADQIFRGMYVVFAEEWLAAFPEGQLMFVLSEDLFADPLPIVRNVWAHLGLRAPSGVEDEKWIAAATAPHKSRRERALPAMLPEARALVDQFYAPYNSRLAELLGDERFLWRRDDAPGLPRRRRHFISGTKTVVMTCE